MTWWANNGCSVRSTNCHYRKVTTTFWSVFLQVIIELTLQLFLLLISTGREVESYRIDTTIVCYEQLMCVSAGVWAHTLVWSLMNVQKPSGETEINKHVEIVASSLSIHFFTPPNKLNKYAITSALIICGAAKCEKIDVTQHTTHSTHACRTISRIDVNEGLVPVPFRHTWPLSLYQFPWLFFPLLLKSVCVRVRFSLDCVKATRF